MEMDRYKHIYTICTVADQNIYDRQCKAIENRLNIKPSEKLTDVDGSDIRIYYYNGKKIKIINDITENGVYVYSEIELRQFFR